MSMRRWKSEEKLSGVQLEIVKMDTMITDIHVSDVLDGRIVTDVRLWTM